LHYALLSEMSKLGPCKVRCLKAFIAFVPKVVENEIDEVAIDAARGNSEALLRLTFLAFHKVLPRKFHLLVHAADEHGVLRPGCNALEDEERGYVVPFEGFKFLVDEAKDAWGDATQRIRERVLEGLN